MNRVLVAGFYHESNTFSPIITGADDFCIHRGAEIVAALNYNDSISGIVGTLQASGTVEVVPVLMARAVPSGLVERRLYEDLKCELLQGIRTAGQLDGICLSLHGSMRIAGPGGRDDGKDIEAEGDILEAIRSIHPDLPLVSALDMHATVTERMLGCADAFVAYKEAPHTDCFETGAHAARLLLEALEGTRLATACCRLPMIIAGEQSETSVEPMRSMVAALRQVEQDKPEVLAASFLLGFPWADCEENGVCALVVSRNSPETTVAEDLARRFWLAREAFCFHTETYPPQEALEVALQAARTASEQPVYLSDSGDNPTAGSSADGTGFLQQLLQTPQVASLNPPLLYAGIYDPSATEACRGQEGQELSLSVGAKFDTKTSSPLTLRGTVRRFVPQWRLGGNSYPADIALFHTKGLDLVLTAKHIGFISPEMFAALGIQAQERKLIVVKLGYLTAPHKAVARRTIMALTEGSSNEQLASLPYHRIPRPFFPKDRDFCPRLVAESYR